jgi:uncharacterized protein YidB (DUF937 family)
MSLFSNLAQSALGALTANSGGNAQSIVTNLVTEMIANHSSGNGLAGLVEQLAASGLGAQAASWVSNGPNIPVTGDQIHQALGPDQIAALAQKVGLPAGQLPAILAQVLPQVINHLTPNGTVPQGASLESALGGLLESSLLKGLTSHS